MPPDRMQMIEKDTAKLEKRLKRRSSSWAYPMPWRIVTSSFLSASVYPSVGVSHVSHIPTPSVDRLPARIHTIAQVPARSCVLAAARRPAGTPHRRFHEIAYALALAIDGLAPEQHDRGWWEARRM